MKILIAPDSFKGSLSAARFCTVAAKAIAAVCASALLLSCPMADGGEGTTEAVVQALGGTTAASEVCGPRGQPVQGQVGYIVSQGLAVVEALALDLVGIDHVFPIVAGPTSLDNAMQQAEDNLFHAVKRVMKLALLAYKRKVL